MTIRTLIVDDEALARERIRSLLIGDPQVAVIGEACNGPEAAVLIKRLKPDLVFLDVQMPEMDGFEVIRAVGVERMPHIIFVTAYDQYAFRAFEVHALDYLLKPFSKRRFKESLARVVQTVEAAKGNGAFRDQVKGLIEKVRSESPYNEWLVVNLDGDRMIAVKTESIEWIEAAGKYVIFHMDGRKFIKRETMAGLESRLDPRKLIRVHRSRIINVAAIKEIQPWFHGEFILIMKDGAKITLSRAYRDKFRALFGGSF